MIALFLTLAMAKTIDSPINSARQTCETIAAYYRDITDQSNVEIEKRNSADTLKCHREKRKLSKEMRGRMYCPNIVTPPYQYISVTRTGSFLNNCIKVFDKIEPERLVFGPWNKKDGFYVVPPVEPSNGL